MELEGDFFQARKTRQVNPIKISPRSMGPGVGTSIYFFEVFFYKSRYVKKLICRDSLKLESWL